MLNRIFFFFLMKCCRFGQEESLKQGVAEVVNRGGADVSSLLQRTQGKGERNKRGESQSCPGGRNEVWCDLVWKELKRSCLLKLEYSSTDLEHA